MGPFDPALHIRSRDHYEAVRREAQLLSLAPEAAPARLEELIQQLTQQFPRSPVDDVADQAYLAKSPASRSVSTCPTSWSRPRWTPATSSRRCWTRSTTGPIRRVQLLEAPEDVRRYRKAYLDQIQAQLQVAAHG